MLVVAKSATVAMVWDRASGGSACALATVVLGSDELFVAYIVAY